jgi:TP901 family phage tail tape measure protein
VSEQVLRLGIDPSGMESGARRARRATDEVRTGARGAAQGTESLGGALTGIQQPLRTVATLAAALGVTFAAGMGLREAISVTNDFSTAQSRLVVATGATGDSLAALQEDARDIFRGVPQDIVTVSTVLGELTTRIDGTREEIRELTRETLDFARVTGTEASTAARNLGQLINALGVPVSETGELLDQLTFAAQSTGINVGDLTRAIIEAGPAFEELGFGVERSIALFAQFERVGARPSEVIGSLNIALTRLAQSGAQDAEAAFGELLESIRDAPSLLGAVEIAAEAFGSRVGAKVAEDIRQGTFEVDAFVDAMRGADGVFRETADAALTNSERWSIFGNNLRDAVAPALTGVAGLAVSLTDDVGLLTDVVVSLAVAMGLAATAGLWGAISGVALAMAGWATSIVGLIASVNSLAAAVALLQTAIGPAGWVLLGITAISAAVFAWRRNQRDLNDTLSESTTALASYRTELAATTQGAREAQLAGLELAIAREREALATLEAAEASARTGRGAEGLAEFNRITQELERQRALVSELEGLYSETAAAVRDGANAAGDLNDALSDIPDVVGEVAERLETSTALLIQATDLGIRQVGIWQDLVRRMERARAISRDMNADLADRVASEREARDIMDALANNLAPQLRAVTAQIGSDLRELPASLSEVRETVPGILGDLNDASVDSASIFEENWLAAVQVVGASLGGVASQVANIATLFATGNIAGGIAASIGAAVSLRGRGSGEEDRAIQRMAEAADRAARAFADLSAAVGRSIEVERLRITGREAEADVLSLQQAQQRQLQDFLDAFLADASLSFGMTPQEMLQRRGAAGDLDLSAPIEEQIAALRAQGDRWSDALADWLDMIKFQAEELDSLVRAQEARAQQQRRAFEMDMDMFAAEIAGDDRRMLELQLQRDAEARMANAQALVDAGIITEEAFASLVDLLETRATQAIRDYEAAQADAVASLEQRIELDLLMAQGRDEEAAIMRLQIQQQLQLAEAMAVLGDASDELLVRLAELHDLQMQNLRDSLRARTDAPQDSVREAVEREVRRRPPRIIGGTEATIRVADPQQAVAQLSALSASQYLQEISRWTRETAQNTRDGVQVQATQAGGGSVTINVTLPNVRDISDPEDLRRIGGAVDEALGGRNARRRRARGEAMVLRG